MGRFRNWLGALAVLRAGGATWRSIALYPLRRRLWHRGQIDVKGGVSFSAPLAYPLFDVFREIWSERHYWLDQLPEVHGTHIVDIGASVGVFSVWAATLFPRTKIVALEPARWAFEQLRTTLSNNRVSNVEPLQLACGGRSGVASFFEHPSSVLNSLVRIDSADGFTQTEVEVVSLDTLFERCGIERCILLKVDSEGAEYEIFLHASPDTLAKIETVAMEYHPVGRPEQLQDLLQRHGFEVETEPMPGSAGMGYIRAHRSGA